jgi:hypothetical protein
LDEWSRGGGMKAEGREGVTAESELRVYVVGLMRDLIEVLTTDSHDRSIEYQRLGNES